MTEEHTSELQSHDNLVCSSDRKSTRLNSSHTIISYAVFCLKKKKNNPPHSTRPHPTHTAPALSGSPGSRARDGRGRGAWGRWCAAGATVSSSFFFFNDTATPEISPLSLHSPLPI